MAQPVRDEICQLLLNEVYKFLASISNEYNFEDMLIYGGYIRDKIAGKPWNDVDIAVVGDSKSRKRYLMCDHIFNCFELMKRKMLITDYIITGKAVGCDD